VRRCSGEGGGHGRTASAAGRPAHVVRACVNRKQWANICCCAYVVATYLRRRRCRDEKNHQHHSASPPAFMPAPHTPGAPLLSYMLCGRDQPGCCCVCRLRVPAPSVCALCGISWEGWADIGVAGVNGRLKGRSRHRDGVDGLQTRWRAEGVLKAEAWAMKTASRDNITAWPAAFSGLSI